MFFAASWGEISASRAARCTSCNVMLSAPCRFSGSPHPHDRHIGSTPLERLWNVRLRPFALAKSPACGLLSRVTATLNRRPEFVGHAGGYRNHMSDFPPEHPRHRPQAIWSEALWSLVLIGIVMLLALLASALDRV
jgi:hypothetical protein